MAKITATLLNSLVAVNKVINTAGWVGGSFIAMSASAMQNARSALLYGPVSSSGTYTINNTRVVGKIKPVTSLTLPAAYAGFSAGSYITTSVPGIAILLSNNTMVHFENAGFALQAAATTACLQGGERQRVIMNNCVFGKIAQSGTANMLYTLENNTGGNVTFNNCIFITKYTDAGAEALVFKAPSMTVTFNNCLFYDINGNVTMIKIDATATNSAVSINGCRFYNIYNGVIGSGEIGSAVNVTGCIFDTVGNIATAAVTAAIGNVTL